MVRRSRKILFTIATMAAVLAFGADGFAQTTRADRARARLDAAAEKIKAACSSDFNKFCSNVNPGEGRVIHCMLAYEDQISTKCDYAVYNATRNLQRALDQVSRVADACWDEIDKRCGSLPEGGGRIAQCLINNKASIKKGCRAAVESFAFEK